MDSGRSFLPTPYQKLMRDVEVVKKYVHDRTDEEIFAYLEAHYNDFNRVEKVVHELRGTNDVFVANDEQNVPNHIGDQHEETLQQIDLNNDQVQSLLGIKQCCWTQSCTCWNAHQTGTLTPANNNAHQTGTFSPVYSNAQQTGTFSPVNNNTHQTGSFSPVNNNTHQTGTFSRVNINACETGSFSSVYNNAHQTGSFSPVNNNMHQTGTSSQVNINARETGSFSPVYNNAQQTGTFSPVYNNARRDTGTFSPVYNNARRDTGTFSPVYQTGGSGAGSGSSSGSGSGSVVSDENFKSYHDERLKTLLEILPDGDPDFFSNFIQTNRGNETFINESVNSWLQKRNYKMRMQQNGKINKKFVDGDMTVEEFLEIFPDPETHFNKPKLVVSKNYQKHVLVYANNNYSLNDAHLVLLLLKHKYNLIPIVREMKCHEAPAVKKVKKELREMPEEVDQLFYQELIYLKLADEIAEFRCKKKEEKRKSVEEAKANGSLMTCECCFEEELLIDDMLPCPKDHLFCRDCISRQAEINIGANKLQFPCFNGYCKEQFSLKVLQSCVRANIFSNIVRKLQEEEIRRAKIPDLVSCPFCSFSAIMPDRSDKVLKCLNPECLKKTCRLCKELDHVPLRCKEAERKPEVDMRTFIENRMSDALLRKCPKCKCRLIKYEGCNKITCTCGQMMCYLCRQPIDGYSHFERTGDVNSKKCPINSNVLELHQKELKTSAEAARLEYIKTHPQSANIILKHDPTKHIPTAQPNQTPNKQNLDFQLRERRIQLQLQMQMQNVQRIRKLEEQQQHYRQTPGKLYCLQSTRTIQTPQATAIHSASNNNNNNNNNGNLATNNQSNNASLKRSYPSTVTCPSKMAHDGFTNSNVSTSASTSHAAVFSGKLVGGQRTNHEQSPWNCAAPGNQLPSFPLLTSLLSPGSPSSSTSLPNAEQHQQNQQNQQNPGESWNSQSYPPRSFRFPDGGHNFVMENKFRENGYFF